MKAPGLRPGKEEEQGEAERMVISSEIMADHPAACA